MTKKEFQKLRQKINKDTYISNVVVFPDKWWKYPTNYRYYRQGEAVMEEDQIKIKKKFIIPRKDIKNIRFSIVQHLNSNIR